MAKIRGNSVLPARRQASSCTPWTGWTSLASSRYPRTVTRSPPSSPSTRCRRTAIVDSQVFRKASWRLSALAGLAVLRFNPRGTSSRRAPPRQVRQGRAERLDVAAAIEFAEFHDLPRPLAGRVVVRHRPGPDARLRPGGGRGRPALTTAAVLPGPSTWKVWADSGKPVLGALVPEPTTRGPCRGHRAVRGHPLRPAWSASTARSTSGWARPPCAGRTTRSWRRSLRR